MVEAAKVPCREVAQDIDENTQKLDPRQAERGGEGRRSEWIVGRERGRQRRDRVHLCVKL
jgi:hypothetical protein